MANSFKLLTFTFLVGVVFAQPELDCDGVNDGLAAILIPCRSGVSACVRARNLTALAPLICVPVARSQFEDFLECQGELYTDQTFATFCSGETCTQRPFSNCTINQRCYQIVERNLGSDVYESCQCSSVVGFNQTLNNCSMNCTNALQDLVDDLGCCANSLPYALRYSTCGVAEDDNYEDGRIVELFSACNVELPDPCIHLFNDSHGAKLVSSMAVILLILGMSLLLI